MLGLLIAKQQDGIDIVDNGGQITGAVLGSRLQDRDEIGPKMSNGFDNTTGAMVRPESSGVESLEPAGKGARVGTASKDPGSVGGLAAVRLVEGQLNVLGKVVDVLQRVLECQILQILHCQLVVGTGLAPISVLHDHDGGAHVLGHPTGETLVSKVGLVEAIGRLLAGVDEDDGRSGALPVLEAVPETLLEGAELGGVVVDQLVEGAVAGGTLDFGALVEGLDVVVDRANFHANVPEEGGMGGGRSR